MSNSNDLSDSEIDFSETSTTKDQNIKTRRAEIEITSSSNGLELDAGKKYSRKKQNKNNKREERVKHYHIRDYKRRDYEKCPCCRSSSSSPDNYNKSSKKNTKKHNKKSTRGICSCFEAGMKFILKNTQNTSACSLPYYPSSIKPNLSAVQPSQLYYCPQPSGRTNANVNQRDFSCLLKRENGAPNYEETPMYMTLRSTVSKN